MRRYILESISSAVAMVLLWVLIVAVVAEAPDLSGVAWLLLAVILLFQMTATAVANVYDMVTGWRARRAQAREDERKQQARRARERRYANREVRTGRGLVRTVVMEDGSALARCLAEARALEVTRP